jgi:hypothetical protein
VNRTFISTGDGLLRKLGTSDRHGQLKDVERHVKEIAQTFRIEALLRE